MITVDNIEIEYINANIFGLKKIIGEYDFKLNEIPDVSIKVKLYKLNDSDEIYFKTSHFIHSPVQAGAYVTSRSSAVNEELALKRAIDTITSYYETAIRDGHEPSDAWLVKNESF